MRLQNINIYSINILILTYCINDYWYSLPNLQLSSASTFCFCCSAFSLGIYLCYLLNLILCVVAMGFAFMARFLSCMLTQIGP